MGAHCLRWLLPHPGCFPLASIYRSVLGPHLRRPSLRSRFLSMQPHPLCCSALQLPATLSSLSRDLCRCNSERPLCALFPLLNKPWKLLWAGNPLHLLPFSFPSQPQPRCCATYGPVSKTCFIFVCFFFFFKLFKAGSKPGPLWV